MKRLWLFACLLLVAMTGLSTAQITYDFTGAGARAEGMGKAFIGVADDASSITWNPAGLVSHDKPILGLSATLVKPRGSFQEPGVPEAKNTGSFDNLTYLSFVSPVRVRGHQFVLAAAYSQISEDFAYGSFTQVDTNKPHELLPNANYSYRAMAFSDYHSNPYVLNFGFGTPVTERVDAGVSANIYTGKAVRKARIVQQSYGYAAIDRLLQEVNRDSVQSLLDSTSFSGINFTLATRYTSDRLNFGAVVRTGYSLKSTTDEKLSDSIWYNGQLKSGGTEYRDDQVTKVDIPWIYGVGVGYKVKPNWLWSMDAEYRAYAGSKARVRTSIKIGSGGNNEEIYTEIDPRYYDCFVLRTGTEYIWTTNNTIFPVVPLRLGAAYVPLPTPELKVNGERSQITMYQLTAGTGVRWSQIWLDLAYTFSTYDQKSESIYNDILQTGTAYNRTHRLNLTFTGYF